MDTEPREGAEGAGNCPLLTPPEQRPPSIHLARSVLVPVSFLLLFLFFVNGP